MFNLFLWTLISTELLCKRSVQAKPVGSNCNIQGLLNVDNVNSCFLEADSTKCLQYITCKRGISLTAATTLKQDAEKLYAATQDPQAFSVYEGRAVWIACLASPGLLRPGPDSDCAACGNACTQESSAEVCLLYCSGSKPVTSIVTSTNTTPNVKVKEKAIILSEGETKNISTANMKRTLILSFLIIFTIIGVVIILCTISLILILIRIITIRRKRIIQQKCVQFVYIQQPLI